MRQNRKHQRNALRHNRQMLGIDALQPRGAVDGPRAEDEVGGAGVEESEELGNLRDDVGGEGLEVGGAGDVVHDHFEEEEGGPDYLVAGAFDIGIGYFLTGGGCCGSGA